MLIACFFLRSSGTYFVLRYDWQIRTFLKDILFIQQKFHMEWLEVISNFLNLLRLKTRGVTWRWLVDEYTNSTDGNVALKYITWSLLGIWVHKLKMELFMRSSSDVFISCGYYCLCRKQLPLFEIQNWNSATIFCTFF